MKLRDSKDVVAIYNNHTNKDEMLINVLSRTFTAEGQPIFITPQQLHDLGTHFDKFFDCISDKYIKLHFGELNDPDCDFVDMLSQIKSKKLTELNIISDLSLMPIEYFNNISDYCQSRNIKFMLTLYHRNAHNDVDCYRKITELRDRNKINSLFSMHITYIISATELPDEDTKDFMNKAIAAGFDVHINLGRDVRMKDVPQEVIDWKDEQTAKIGSNCHHEDDYTLTYSDGTQQSFRTIYDVRYALDNNVCTEGYYCSAGITQLCIYPNGNVVRHACSHLRKFKPLGNIITDDNIQLPKKYIRCGIDTNENCPSSGRMNIFKNKPQ